MKRILFVCTGNTCRSPMAEAILREMAKKHDLDIEVQSAGVSAASGMPASVHAQTILKERKSPKDHSAQPIKSELLHWADLVLTMTVDHKEYMIQQYPQEKEKIYTLKEFVNNQQQVHHLVERFEQLSKELQESKKEWDRKCEEEWLKKMEPKISKANQLIHRIDILKNSLNISDPFGGPESIYRECANEIEQAIEKLLKKVKEKND